MTKDECFEDANRRIVRKAEDRGRLEARISQLEADNAALMEVVRKLSKLNAEVLATWTARHAPDHCADSDVEAANKRCGDGTLWYIATSNKAGMDIVDALPAHLKEEASK
ncbi:hypothetical protein E6C67_08565 [Azospirillum sp. TSA2s]|uniref:hypothetical protein n=1 Tax=Azospirillum sp. TSA2s TaxID=709810 RepID=UPI0010AA67D3|nr:hypothetical protein [Azospirillum sp. TSA2s]QCG93991.1 hypothetical protein E6C67_08565 [Azospirillum sp. TSA2s]